MQHSWTAFFQGVPLPAPAGEALQRSGAFYGSALCLSGVAALPAAASEAPGGLLLSVADFLSVQGATTCCCAGDAHNNGCNAKPIAAAGRLTPWICRRPDQCAMLQCTVLLPATDAALTTFLQDLVLWLQVRTASRCMSCCDQVLGAMEGQAPPRVPATEHPMQTSVTQGTYSVQLAVCRCAGHPTLCTTLCSRCRTPLQMACSGSHSRSSALARRCAPLSQCFATCCLELGRACYGAAPCCHT